MWEIKSNFLPDREANCNSGCCTLERHHKNRRAVEGYKMILDEEGPASE